MAKAPEIKQVVELPKGGSSKSQPRVVPGLPKQAVVMPRGGSASSDAGVGIQTRKVTPVEPKPQVVVNKSQLPTSYRGMKFMKPNWE